MQTQAAAAVGKRPLFMKFIFFGTLAFAHRANRPESDIRPRMAMTEGYGSLLAKCPDGWAIRRAGFDDAKLMSANRAN